MNITLSKTFDIRKKKAAVILKSGRENDLGVLVLTEGMRLKAVRLDIRVYGPFQMPGKKKTEALASGAVAQACRVEVALTQGKYTRCLLNENADDFIGRKCNLATDVAPILRRGASIQAWLNVYDRHIAKVMLQGVRQEGLFSLHCSLTFSGPAYKERRMKP